MSMTCPKCGEKVSWEDTDVIIWSMGEKQITVWHQDPKCDGKWVYKRMMKNE